MSLSTGYNQLKILIIDQDTNTEKYVVQYNDLDYQHLLELEAAIMSGISQLNASLRTKK